MITLRIPLGDYASYTLGVQIFSPESAKGLAFLALTSTFWEQIPEGTPRIIYEEEGQRKTLTCDFVMGCDSRRSFVAQIH